MKSWLQSLHTAPEPLTVAQRRFLWIAAFLVAASRFMALARSLWDWDEALFSYALRDYNVAAHHPHPPGFPLFILFAKGVHLVVASEFRSLQIVTMLGAVALFPLMIFLGRELRMRFTPAVIAALLVAFAPNVWVFGGSAFSDVPSLALSLLAVALLLRGCRSGGAYLAGALLLGIAAGFRPQNLVIGMVPSLLASWYRVRASRSPLPLLLAALIGGGCVAGAYGGAAAATGDWATYRHAVQAHQQYITTVDSISNPRRPPLPLLFDDFFLRPYRMKRLNVAMSLLCAVALLGALAGRRATVLAALSIFGPFCILGWLMLDVNSVGRFSVAWSPLIAIAAAEGLAMLAGLLRVERRAWIAQCAGGAYLVGTMFVWTAPALRIVRRTKSPPVQAVEWIQDNLPRSTPLFVHGSMGPHSDLLLGDYSRESVGDDPVAPSDGRKPWLIREGLVGTRGSHAFTYPRGRLWQIVRQRYFEVSVSPVLAQMRMGEGWYDEESNEQSTWHWMGVRGTLLLQTFSGPGRLILRAYVPLDAVKVPPTITVTFNGQVIDRFVPNEADFTRTYVAASRPNGWNELRLETSEAVNQVKRGTGPDPRDLGLRLDEIEWSIDGAPPSTPR